jgi:YD repeat-containing protein
MILLSGNVKSVTDSFNSTINYSYDAVGRTTSVSGSSYGGVTSYASNVQVQ